ncbi:MULTISPECIES: hypothetical protein [unclassified Bradyrhizobium]|uniref:hypothetical protein n=1 Tax=unclassified Bradyrhizobium TaxID=2631580 RepID=UPI003D205A1C
MLHLMICEASEVAAIAPFGELMEGSAVVLSDGGLISGFRMKQTAAHLAAEGLRLFKTINLLRLSVPPLRTTIIPALDDIIESGATQAYTEELFGYLVERGGPTTCCGAMRRRQMARNRQH